MFASGLREPLWQCWATPGQIFAAWHLGITCHERHVWHMTPCEPSQHKYRARTWPESHFRGNLRWQMPLSSLSVNIRPWDWVLDPWWGQWRWLVEIWSGSWQHWHHYCLLKVYNTNKMWRWWGLVALGDGVTKVSWATHRHFLWSRHDHNCPSSALITRGPELWSCLLIGCLNADYPIRCQNLASVTVGGKCQRGRRMGTKCSISQLIAVRSQTNCQASILIKSQKSSWLSFCFGTFNVEMERAHSGR